MPGLGPGMTSLPLTNSWIPRPSLGMTTEFGVSIAQDFAAFFVRLTKNESPVTL
jgi:hypothetical protein